MVAKNAKIQNDCVREIGDKIQVSSLKNSQYTEKSQPKRSEPVSIENWASQTGDSKNSTMWSNESIEMPER